MDSVNYFRSRQLPVGFIIATSGRFPDQENISYHTKKYTKTGLDLSMEYLLGLLFVDFPTKKASFVDFTSKLFKWVT